MLYGKFQMKAKLMFNKLIFPVKVLLFAIVILSPLVNTAFGKELTFKRSSSLVKVSGVNFQFVWDLGKGGEISEILVHDGKDILRVNSTAPSYSTVPNYSFVDADRNEYSLSNCKNTEFELIYEKDDEVKFVTKGKASTRTGKVSPWIIEQTFRVFKVGVVFCDIDITMAPCSEFNLCKASITFPINEDLATKKFRWTYDKALPDPNKIYSKPFTYLGIEDSARYKDVIYPYIGANFGVGENVFYSNHAEFVIENFDNWKLSDMSKPKASKHIGSQPKESVYSVIAAKSNYWFRHEKSKGMLFSWSFFESEKPFKLLSPYRHKNRWGLGISGIRKSSRKETPFILKNNTLGSCIYHWCKWKIGGGRFGTKDWYPTNAQVDEMAKLGCDILILHHGWMRNGGQGSTYMADYVPADSNEYERVIDYCHSKDIRVGVYIRGLEYDQLDRDVSWFTDYLQKDYDGIYVDWTSFLYPPMNAYSTWFPICEEDVEFHQPTETSVSAFANFLYTKKLRELVGENGFLIGHPGNYSAEPTTIAMAYYDTVLIGEGHMMFIESTDKNICYSGLVGNGTAIWGGSYHEEPGKTLKSKRAVAYYAAFDNNPEMVLGYPGPTDLSTSREYQYQLVLWKMYNELDERNLTVFNPSVENKDIVKFSNPDFHGVIYTDNSGRILLIVSNFGEKQSCQTKINFKTIKARGQYTVYELKGQNYDSYSKTKIGKCENGKLQIGPFEQYEYRGYLLTKTESARLF